jgi:hypothetical protein
MLQDDIDAGRTDGACGTEKDDVFHKMPLLFFQKIEINIWAFHVDSAIVHTSTKIYRRIRHF